MRGLDVLVHQAEAEGVQPEPAASDVKVRREERRGVDGDDSGRKKKLTQTNEGFGGLG